MTTFRVTPADWYGIQVCLQISALYTISLSEKVHRLVKCVSRVSSFKKKPLHHQVHRNPKLILFSCFPPRWFLR